MAGRAIKLLRWITVPTIVAALLYGGVLVYRTWINPPPVLAIERLLNRATGYAQDENILGLSRIFASDYRDASGMDRAAILGQAQRFFAQTEELEAEVVNILYEDAHLSSSAEKARAVVTLRSTGKTGGNAFQGIAGPGADTFLLDFERIEGAWKVSYSKRLRGENAVDLLRQIRTE